MAVGAVLREAKSSVQSLLNVGPDFAPQPLGRHIDPEGIAGYWCDLRHKSVVADESPDGLPHDGAGRRIDWVIPIAQAALGAWERRYDGEQTDDRFLALARRLRDDATVERDGSLSWRTMFGVPKYGLPPGWTSAMGQGQAMSVFLRAHALTGDAVWRDDACRALPPLLAPVSRGGLQRRIDDALVLEEYPTPGPCAVLNGWIFALLGVHELAVATEDERAAALFAESRAGLLRLLPRYDVGWWSLYSLFDHGRRDLAKSFYQRLHPVMLDALDVAAPDPRLGAMADRWRRQRHGWAVVAANADKVAFRLYRGMSPAVP